MRREPEQPRHSSTKPTAIGGLKKAMRLVKTTMLSGLAVFVKVATMLGLNKVLAVYVVPEGFAALGQFQNALQLSHLVGGACCRRPVECAFLICPGFLRSRPLFPYANVCAFAHLVRWQSC